MDKQCTLCRNLQEVTKKLCPVCVVTVGELWIQLPQILHSCIVQALTQSLRPCMNKSDKLSLIYGTEKTKLVVTSNTALLLFPSNAKIK